MKKLLLSIFILISGGAIACSGIPMSFCFVKSTRTGDHVICGVITAKASHSLQMAVIDVLEGVETRTLITVWDGKDFDCNGNVSMKVSDLGAVGDTLISILPMISTLQNSWDVVGDYSRPRNLFQTAWLKVSKDTVRGYIYGDPYAPNLKHPYADFKSYWQSHNKDCVTMSIHEATAEKLKVIVHDGQINVNSLSGDRFSLKLHTADGRLLAELPADRQHHLDCFYLPPGVYLLRLNNGSDMAMTRKFIL